MKPVGLVVIALSLLGIGYFAGAAVALRRATTDLEECNYSFDESVRLGLNWKFRALSCENATVRREAL